MQTTPLGSTGIEVSRLSMGTATFGAQSDERASFAILDACAAAGVNLIDTANVYPLGSAAADRGASERIVGAWLQGRRQHFIVASKGGAKMGHSPGEQGNSRQHLLDAVDASLKRLGTDYLDLYQLHVPCDVTPIEETLSALTNLVHQGKVRYLGCSNVAAWQIADADWTARTAGLERFVSVQNRYTLLDRELEDEVVPACETFGLGVLPYFPLEYGLLTGKYTRGSAAPAGSRAALDPDRSQWLAEADWDRIEALTAYAGARDLSILDVAIAGLAAQPAVGSVIAGVTSGEQVRANAAAVRWEPTPADLVELDDLTG